MTGSDAPAYPTCLVYLSQWFWLLLVLGRIYFVVGRGIVPKVEATVDPRDTKIAADLAAAERAQAEADATEEAYRAADGREPRRGVEATQASQGGKRARRPRSG